MASTSRKNRRPLTEAELQREADNLWENESENDIDEDMFGGVDSDEDYVEEQLSDSNNEQSEDEDEVVDEPVRNIRSLLGKNGHRWSTQAPARQGRTRRENIVLHLPGPKGESRTVQSPEQAWNLLFNEQMINIIILQTNEEITRKCNDIRKQSYTRPVNKTEVKAFIGLLFLAGALRVSNCNLDELWSVKFGNGIFRATMSQQRFQFIALCLRFDSKETRAERRLVDKFAPIRGLFDMFVDNSKLYYTPYEYCTIDEQLLGYRGKCPFRIYMASKPDKYGMKIMMLNDSKTWYMLNAIPYVGKVTTENNESVPAYYVRKLSQPIHGTNRNITVDNWFTSIPLAEQMLEQYKLTLLGTLRKNKREIPATFLTKKEVGSSLFAFDRNKTLVSYTPKPNKIVLLLSTLHYDVSLNAVTEKPNIIHSYTTSRKTRRWPLRIFFNMLDASGINAIVLFSLSNPLWRENRTNNRKSFLKQLGMSLIEPWLQERLTVPTLQKTLRQRICEIVEIEVTPPQHAVHLPKKVRCSLCAKGRERKTSFACSACRKPYCMEHRAQLYCECERQDPEN